MFAGLVRDGFVASVFVVLLWLILYYSNHLVGFIASFLMLHASDRCVHVQLVRSAAANEAVTADCGGGSV
jgi:hypothetical protein